MSDAPQTEKAATETASDAASADLEALGLEVHDVEDLDDTGEGFRITAPPSVRAKMSRAEWLASLSPEALLKMHAAAFRLIMAEAKEDGGFRYYAMGSDLLPSKWGWLGGENGEEYETPPETKRAKTEGEAARV